MVLRRRQRRGRRNVPIAFLYNPEAKGHAMPNLILDDDYPGETEEHKIGCKEVEFMSFLSRDARN